ncbi:zinc-ribbon domain-containing protein [Methanobacterium sp.]|uniref:zinc-ribbon domain-containing protein n=1 Tax=Methanobacterium sp. TaxID=2164 RepID=UPI003C72A894
MFCKDCGTQNPDDAKYCINCSKKLTFPAEELGYQPPENSKGNYNKFSRSVSLIFGIIFLLSSLAYGWPYYFESETLAVLICEVLATLISIILILLAVFPNCIKKGLNSWMDIEKRYTIMVIIIILLFFIVLGLEPEPTYAIGF